MGECLKPSKEAGIIVCGELPLITVPEENGVLFMFDIGGDEDVDTLDDDVEHYFAGGNLAALEDLNEVKVDDLLDVDLSWRGDNVFDVAGAEGHVAGVGGGVGEVDGPRPQLVGGVAGVGREGQCEQSEEGKPLIHPIISIRD